jgi:predicted permease
MDYRVFAFTMTLAASAGIISGLIPGLRIARADLASALKEGGRISNQGSSTQRFRDVLVAAQVAVCLVLLVSAGLFFRSTRNAAKQDFGFDVKDRLVIATDTRLQHYDEPRSRVLYREWLDRVRATPGVISASMASFLPIGFGAGMREVFIEGVVPEPNKPAAFAFYNTVETGYFQTMGMPILRGRDFNENDTDQTPKVAIVNEVMASRFWPGQDPIGRMFRTKADEPPIKVIGITRVVKFVLPAENPNAGFYTPFSQDYSSNMVLTVHTKGDAMRLAPSVRSELQSLDPDMPVWDVRTLETHILRGKMILFDIGANIMGAFGLIGMTLAAVGLYGLMAFIVNQRTHEIGVRMALGETSAGVLGMIVRQAVVRALVGIAIGLAGAYGVTRLLTNFLVGVSPTDLVTFSVVTVFLVVVAVLAALAPALRATHVDPVIALRGE